MFDETYERVQRRSQSDSEGECLYKLSDTVQLVTSMRDRSDPPDHAHVELKRYSFLGTLRVSLAEAICCRPAGLIRQGSRRGMCGHAA